MAFPLTVARSIASDPTSQGRESHMSVVVKNQVTPHVLWTLNGNKDESSCGFSGG